jgi:CheY-like chemotaxis protein/anti-sigma regulatory factor (Ser/Thr protein kinase)
LLTDDASHKPEILVVDDEEVIRTLMISLFRRDGRFSAASAVHGRDALRLLEEGSYSLVITDLQMPVLGGLPLLREIRQSYPDLPVMVFTGYGDMQDAIEALRLGAVNFLRKPFDLQEILPSVARAIEMTHRLRRKRQVYGFVDSIETEMTIPPRLESKDLLIQHLIDPLAPMGIVRGAEVKNVYLALDEVVNNAITYGALGIDSKVREGEDGARAFEAEVRARGMDPVYSERRVRVNARYRPAEAVFQITDPGEGFDWRSLPDPTDPENLLREHGRGLLLIQCFMDELQFNEKGNEVTLVKRRME